MDKKPLTKRQKEVLDFIAEYIEEYGYAPSYREIGKKFKLTSTATIAQHVSVLEAKGYIKSSPTLARSIQLMRDEREESMGGAVDIPLAGLITAGQPIEAIQQNELISIPENLLSQKECFALKVKGDSMIDDGIHDGDYVVVERTTFAKNGDTVVALIDNESATLKKIYRENGRVRLQPANSEMEPIIVEGRVDVQGKVIGLVRRY